MSTAAYRDLEDRFRRVALLGESIGVLAWDQSVMMPEGGAAARSEQIAALAVIRHSMMTDAALPDLLDEAADHDGLDAWQTANCGKCGAAGFTPQPYRRIWSKRYPRHLTRAKPCGGRPGLTPTSPRSFRPLRKS